MKILITGHKGFIGRNFWRKLDKKSNYLYGVDIKDGNDCRDLFKKDFTRFDLVIHAAGIVGGRQLIEDEPFVIANNLSIDTSLFEWAVKSKPRRIVYFSSSAIYPVNLQERNKVKLKESLVETFNGGTFSTPDKTYGWSKLIGEVLAKEYRSVYGGKIHVARIFSGYGTDQDLDYPFPSLIKRGKDKETPFIIWGNGKQVRDFIHIKDIIGSINELIKNEVYYPINIGSGIPVSFEELAHLIMKQVGYKADLKLLKQKPTGVTYRVADNSKIKRLYKIKISLEEGIKMALNNKI